MGISLLFSISAILKDSPSDRMWAFAEARVLEVHTKEGRVNDLSRKIDIPKDYLLDGLLSPDFNKRSCLSRYQSTLYGKGLSHKPSSYLISKLRKYESLHKRCGPYTKSYNETIKRLQSSQDFTSSDPSDCNYLVWISFSGLGNRILTLTSAFLYALLTNRVLLVDRGADIPDLFCEPFPETSWLLPKDSLLGNNGFDSFNQKSPQSYGNMLKKGVVLNQSSVYVHLVHDYDDQDKLFFCDQDQMSLNAVPLLIMKTDNYFVPSLFLIPSFERELDRLFPVKETVFHFLGRYLFHPTNKVWGFITRYHRAYLAKADQKLGIQIRVFDSGNGPFQHVLDQILSCTRKQNLLPNMISTEEEEEEEHASNPKTKAVLITSLSSGYSERMRDVYWENPTSNGEIVGVFQPSHEEYQQTEKQTHNVKAWAEMYLLSLMDELVTSSWSTFGYVAQGLGGIRPWILYKPENRTTPDPPCQRAVSMEPCFHAPAFYDCKKKVGADTGAMVAHVRHCEDMSWGLKLVDPPAH
ncbi:galactoside 2-alpha-L-fucosyltransferase-like [Impatiens glandulifera]|uniref:galactoside 2-alpha-L-fucosyltransferase-like n=1 Tax=Impatiens glandulifera TaxID=253017 RepID=UPI001FB0787F|nr:galactoside 2-alpha-L-fucosyltransferase-like [Impatiens glandulifera]XP_047332450.1 galactoside 2-alpha-L-fucosyltransferase-like [Impatiens glandulifera]